jgi:L-alanine-DL-glutamate epimerase-like enolase superfamily enzyme
MKIVAIETSVVSTPFEMGGPPWIFAGKSWERLDILLVRVETEDGRVGWGEAFGHASVPSVRAALDDIVAPLYLGRDAGDADALTGEILQKVHLLGRNGPFVYAVSGVDIALWDIAGKRAGEPLHRLFGGGAERLQGYASLLRYGDAALVAANARAAYERGFRAIKLHEVTREAVLAAKGAIGADALLMLDTNCPWSVAEACAMARAMKDDGLHWLEEPVWPPEDHAGLARVRKEGIPLAAGENAAGCFDFEHMFERGAIDVAQPSVTKIGGIGEMRRVIALGERYGVRVVPHCPYFGPGFLASLHLIAAMPSRPPVEVLWMELEANPFDPWVRARDGALAVPQGPGLGCDPDPETLRRYTVGPARVHRLPGRA